MKGKRASPSWLDPTDRPAASLPCVTDKAERTRSTRRVIPRDRLVLGDGRSALFAELNKRTVASVASERECDVEVGIRDGKVID